MQHICNIYNICLMPLPFYGEKMEINYGNGFLFGVKLLRKRGRLKKVLIILHSPKNSFYELLWQVYSPEHSRCEVIEVKWYLSLRGPWRISNISGEYPSMAHCLLWCGGVCLFLGRANEGNYRQREREREKEESKSLFWFVSCEHNLFLK